MSGTGVAGMSLDAQLSAPDLERRLGAALARTALLRRLGDIMAAEPGLPGAVLRAIVDVVAETLGSIVVVRTFSEDRRRILTEVVSEPRDPGTAHDAAVLRCALLWDPGWPPDLAARVNHRLWSSLRTPDWREDLGRCSPEPLPAPLRHVVSAPIRADRLTYGFLRCVRTTSTPIVDPFQPGDDDLVQIVADRLGSALTEKRLRTRVERAELDGRAAVERLSQLRLEYASLVEQLSTVEERERVLLAEAIHDEPMQLIVAVMMLMDSTPDQLRPPGLDRWIDVLERAVGKLRSLIISMTPPDLSDGLGLALRRLAEGIFVGWPMIIETTGVERVSLSPNRASTTYRIAREALVNIRKHAQATTVRIDLTQSDGHVRLLVTDNGVGAGDLTSRPGHLGVSTMRARAIAEGGILDITAAPGGGTAVSVRVPTENTSSADP